MKLRANYWAQSKPAVFEYWGGGSVNNCCELLRPNSLPLQKNALRIEAITAEPRCALRPKKDQFGRKYNVARFVVSGGCASQAAKPCVGPDSPRCPRNVEAEDGLMNNFKSGPCPHCRRINRREGYGPAACRGCGYTFNLVGEVAA